MSCDRWHWGWGGSFCREADVLRVRSALDPDATFAAHNWKFECIEVTDTRTFKGRLLEQLVVSCPEHALRSLRSVINDNTAPDHNFNGKGMLYLPSGDCINTLKVFEALRRLGIVT